MDASAHSRGDVAAKALGLLAATLLMAGISGCATREVAAPAPGQAAPGHIPASPLIGQPFDVDPAGSRLIVLAYRAGALATLGHNHVIACRCLTGTVYLPRDPLRGSFDLRLAVQQLTVDDPELRSSQHSADFPPDVPQSARQGTRHNMLGAALLNAAKYPEIRLRSAGLRRSPDGKAGDIVARVLLQVEGATHSIAVPMHYEIRADEIVVTGEFPLKQTDLGLTPFTALGGALRVRNSLEVRLRLLARRRVS